MEDLNEDIFVIIIGDKEENTSAEVQTPKVKIEQLEGHDFFLEDIFKTAKTHGVQLNMDEVKYPLPFKKEPLSDYTYSKAVEMSSVAIEFSKYLDVKEESLVDDVNDENYISNLDEDLNEDFSEDFDKDVKEFRNHITNKEQKTKVLRFTEKINDCLNYEEYNLQHKDYGGSKGVPKRKNAKRKTKMLKSAPNSFVKTLIVENPHLNMKPDSLVNLLFRFMKSTKAPPLPQIHYKSVEKGFSCIKCTAITRSEAAAGRHYQDHHGPRSFFCFACGVDFRSKQNLLRHEMRCRAPDISYVLKARAKYLGRKGRSRPFLDTTLPYCNPRVPINKSKEKKSPLRYYCDKCSASYITQVGLMAHNNMHSGERPFLCSECSATYTSQTSLWRHMKTHTDMKFICDYCKREFKAKTALATHINRHLPQKPFPCHECPKRFARKLPLTIHVNRVHRNLSPPCACQLCPKRYFRMSVLKDHMKKVHGMTLVTRMMLFKSLPKMPQTLIQNGKVLLGSEVPYFKDGKCHENNTNSNQTESIESKEHL